MSFSEYEYGEEAISSQFDDSFPMDFEKAIDSFLKACKIEGVSGRSAFKNKNVRPQLERIDEVCSERFGLNFHFIHSVFTPAAVFTPTLGDFTQLHDHRTQTDFDHSKNPFEWYREVLWGRIPDYIFGEMDDIEKDRKKARLFEDNQWKLSGVWNKQRKDLAELLKYKDIKVDFDKAIITGFPSDQITYIISDFWTLKSSDMTIKEIVAIFLHEIGHAFTHLASLCKMIRTNVLLQESLQDSLKHKNETTKVLTLTSKNVFKVPIYQPRHFIERFLTDIFYANMYPILRLIYEPERDKRLIRRMDSKDTTSYSDSERMADQFPSRFGYGEEIVSGLYKLHDGYGFRMNLFFEFIIFHRLIWYVLLALGVAGVPVIVSVYLNLMLSILLRRLFHSLFWSNGNKSSRNTYDDYERRLKRVKTDQIRMLRTMDLDKKDKVKLIKAYEAIEEISEQLVRKTGIQFSTDTSAILADYIPINWIAKNNTELYDMIEELMENKLHLEKAKYEVL